jgi:hypothetical protein
LGPTDLKSLARGERKSVDDRLDKDEEEWTSSKSFRSRLLSLNADPIYGVAGTTFPGIWLVLENAVTVSFSGNSSKTIGS